MGTQGNGFVIKAYRLEAYLGNEEHIVIPEGVRVIGCSAFSGNDRIRAVDSHGVSSIEAGAFEGCSALEAIIMRKDLQDIGKRAFAGCRSLRSIGCAPRKSSDEEWHALLYIADEAFAECTSLESVDFYEVSTWLEVGERCFLGCTALSSVVLGVALTSLGDDVFEGCTALERISLPIDLRNQTPDEADHHERVLQTIRDSCPSLQILERREFVTMWEEDENHEFWVMKGDPLPWSTETFRRNVRHLAYREHAGQLTGRGMPGLFQGYVALEQIDFTDAVIDV